MHNERFGASGEPQYSYQSTQPYASAPSSALIPVLVSILGTLLVVTLVGGLVWWMLQDSDAAAAPGSESFELNEIEVPGREGTLSANGGADSGQSAPVQNAVVEAADDAPVQEQPPVPDAWPGAITSVSVAGGTETMSSLPCDGRYVLITASILDNTPDPAGQIASAMAMSPESMFLAPGACPSLRGFYQGGNVYPVLVDYGFDVEGVCAAARRGGGNARILSDRSEYLSPC